MIISQFRSFAQKIINPLVQILVRNKVNPNTLTFLGFLLTLVAAGIFVYGAEFGSRTDFSYIGWGGFMILFAGAFDMFDGQVARQSGRSTSYGALYDSVLDRYSELFMFFGICYYLVSHDYFLSSMFAFIALIGSVMVSYTRARAEALGLDSNVGLMQRPERVVLIGAAAVICGIAGQFIEPGWKIESGTLPFPVFETISIFTFPIFILAVLANLTAIRRLLHAKASAIKKGEKL
ncbi:CDP-alcohol phosphatidyltransferase family protein [Chitinophagales bacterium]|nr:CDP-alcohol phosphatidyltransferase family protein [Chitinophagales bacterium]